VRLVRLAELGTETRELLMHALVVSREDARRLCRRGEQRAGLLRRHGPVPIGRDVGAGFEGDVEELALADAYAGLVEQRGDVEDAFGRKAVRAQALQRLARDGVHPVAGVDRLRYTPDGPDRRAVMAARVLVLDVVVDEREVVQQLHRGADGSHAHPVAAERLEDEHAEHRPQSLAAARALGIEAEVVEHHPVEGLEPWVALGEERSDLVVARGDPRVEYARRSTVPLAF
jgi:hypothetical protein